MSDAFSQAVFETLCGNRIPEACVPGVENAFAPGATCDLCYEAAAAARERLFQRLGVDDDPDLECIFDELMYLARELALKMFAYGQTLKPLSHVDEW